MLAIRCRSAGSRGRDRLVEVALDQAREALVEAFVSAWNTRPAPIVSRNSSRAMVRWPGERRKDRVDRGLGARNGSVSRAHRPLDPRHELVGGRLHELAEDRFLVREVEVDRRPSRSRRHLRCRRRRCRDSRASRTRERPRRGSARGGCDSARSGRARHRGVLPWEGLLGVGATDRPVGRSSLLIVSPETWYGRGARCWVVDRASRPKPQMNNSRAHRRHTLSNATAMVAADRGRPWTSEARRAREAGDHDAFAALVGAASRGWTRRPA